MNYTEYITNKNAPNKNHHIIVTITYTRSLSLLIATAIITILRIACQNSLMQVLHQVSSVLQTHGHAQQTRRHGVVVLPPPLHQALHTTQRGGRREQAKTRGESASQCLRLREGQCCAGYGMGQPTNQPTNQPPINQSINKPTINQSINQSTTNQPPP